LVAASGHYRAFVVTDRLQRVYLDELPPEMGDLSKEMGDLSKEEGLEEGKAEVLMQTIPMLLQAGVSVQAIADQLNITIEQVQQFAQSRNA
jgi:predicted transposase/invertase (TIGR01784 family)